MKAPLPQPPRFFQCLLRWFLVSHRAEELEGDLDELFCQRVDEFGLQQARWRYVRDVASLLRPSLLKPQENKYPRPTNTTMLRNYLTVAFRNLVKNQVYSFINIFGLASGMVVAMLIGLWIYDELSFDRQFTEYDRLAKVWQFVKFDVKKSAYDVVPVPLADELRRAYPDFDAVSVSAYRDVILAEGDKKFLKNGNYVDPDFTRMFSLNMLAGAANGLTDVNTILLSQSTATALFGSTNPINQLIRLDNKQDVKVVGVYNDFPANSTFKDVAFLAPWKLLVATNSDAKNQQDQWDSNSYNLFAQLKPGADFDQVSAKIKDIRMKRDNPPSYKPEFFLHPMTKWHLYRDFNDGVNTGGLITFV